jgi:hypothetical protein
MPLVYFNAYNTVDGFSEYQRTGSTATWIDNTDTSGFSSYTGINQFWPSPSAGNDGDQGLEENFIICWADNSVANTSQVDGVTAKVSYWSVPYSAEDADYLSWLNEAIRCTGGTPAANLTLALGTAVNRGIWTNYNTDITPGLVE